MALTTGLFTVLGTGLLWVLIVRGRGIWYTLDSEEFLKEKSTDGGVVETFQTKALATKKLDPLYWFLKLIQGRLYKRNLEVKYISPEEDR